jgi:hypothetical protein
MDDLLTPKERADEMRLAIIIYHIAKWAVFGLIAALLIGALCSCSTQQKIVPVPEIHENHHWHTDTVHQTDSIIRETQTTIMQLDSAAMAKYGIQLKNAERAWLVKSKELERQIQQLMQLSQIKDTMHDSIPYPVEVIKEVPAELSWWQGLLVRLGYCSLGIVIIYLIYLRFKR